jgi:hypothetical protein
LWTICLGWPWIAVLLISASWVAMVTGMRHPGAWLEATFRGAMEAATLGFLLFPLKWRCMERGTLFLL